MRKIKTKRMKFLLVLLTFIVVNFLGLVYFFYANEAPITKGEVSYNVTYKENLSLDIYHPTRWVHDKSPVVLFIHGGAWIVGRKESMNVNRVNGAINKLREQGYTIISIAYTLAREGRSPFPTCIQDSFDAVGWITAHADSLRLDLDNFGIMGESAGAHIALINAFSNPKDFGLTQNKVDLKYVVDIYGPVDLYRLYHSATLDSLMSIINGLPQPIHEHLNLAHLVFGFDPETNLEQTRRFAAKYSPVTYLHHRLPPVLMIHGNADQVVPFDQSQVLQHLLDSLGVPNEFHELEAVNHAFIGANEAQKKDVQRWIFDFIENQNTNQNQTSLQASIKNGN